MNLRVSATLAACAIVGLLAIVRSVPVAAAEQGQAARVVTVTIVFQCAGTRSVSPWEVHVDQGDEIDWVLDPSSDVTDFEIKKKRVLQRWLFQNDHPARGRRDDPARGRQMRGGSDGTHAYNIEAPCPGPGGSTRVEVIDPDIIVD